MRHDYRRIEKNIKPLLIITYIDKNKNHKKTQYLDNEAEDVTPNYEIRR
jgi:hypothetical protein